VAGVLLLLLLFLLFLLLLLFLLFLLFLLYLLLLTSRPRAIHKSWSRAMPASLPHA